MPHRPCRIRASFFLTLLMCGFAPAQTTQPAPPIADAQASAPATQPANSSEVAWTNALSHLGSALCGGDMNVLSAALEGGPILRTFDSDSLQTPDQLLTSTNGAKLIGLHAYKSVPTRLASDMTEDFKAPVVSEDVRHDMSPPDDAAEKLANATAAQWIVQSLHPAADQAVGAIVLWKPDPGASFGAASAHLVFVLVKGELVGGQYIFRQISFGDPLEGHH